MKRGKKKHVKEMENLHWHKNDGNIQMTRIEMRGISSRSNPIRARFKGLPKSQLLTVSPKKA